MGGRVTIWRSRWVGRAATLLVLSAALENVTAAQDLDRITMDDIVVAWKARHQQIRSGRFAWTETKWIRKGTLPSSGPSTQADTPLPEDDTLISYNCTLVFEGERMRFESAGDKPLFQGALDQHHTGVWNGAVGKDFRHGGEIPNGEVYDFAWDLTQQPLWPFRVAFRMLHPQWFSLQIDEFVLSSRRDVIEGHPNIVIETAPAIIRKQAGGRLPAWKDSYWISPDQDFAVTRYARTSDMLPGHSAEFRVSYQRDAEYGWYPSTWRYVDGSTETPNEVREGTLTSHALNVAVDPAAFDFEFPAGTLVRDTLTNEYYLVRELGEKRIVTDAELRRGANYSDLLASETGQARTTTISPRYPPWLLWAAVTILAICAGLFWLRGRV